MTQISPSLYRALPYAVPLRNTTPRMRNASDYLRDENEEELKYRSSVNTWQRNKSARNVKLDILALVIRILITVITLGLVM